MNQEGCWAAQETQPESDQGRFLNVLQVLPENTSGENFSAAQVSCILSIGALDCDFINARMGTARFPDHRGRYLSVPILKVDAVWTPVVAFG